LGFFSAKPNQFFRKIINIGSLGNAVVNEKDISFQKKPEALLPEVFESLRSFILVQMRCWLKLYVNLAFVKV